MKYICITYQIQRGGASLFPISLLHVKEEKKPSKPLAGWAGVRDRSRETIASHTGGWAGAARPSTTFTQSDQQPLSEPKNANATCLRPPRRRVSCACMYVRMGLCAYKSKHTTRRRVYRPGLHESWRSCPEVASPAA